MDRAENGGPSGNGSGRRTDPQGMQLSAGPNAGEMSAYPHSEYLGSCHVHSNGLHRHFPAFML